MKRPLFFGCICLVAIIALWTYCFDPPPFYGNLPIEEQAQITLQGQVYEKEKRSYYGTEMTILYLKSIAIIDSDTSQVSKLNSQYKIICELEKGQQEPDLGRILQISGNWRYYEGASNPGEFDAADYYGVQNIIGKLEKGRLEKSGDSYWHIREGLYRLREICTQRLYQALPEDKASVLAKMLLGVENTLNAETKELYQRNGIVHILSISGLHITMIGMGFYKLFRRCGCPILPAAAAGIICLLLYGCMTGFGISCVRAIGMYLIHMLGEITGRSYDLLTGAGVLMAVMVCSNPRLLYHCGFLLSFGSVLGIGILCPILPLQKFMVKKNLGRDLLQGLWTSTAITVFTLPISLYFFFEISLYSPLVNLLVLPFMGSVMVLGFLLILMPEMLFPAWIETLILEGFSWICRLAEKLPGHTWTAGRPALWQIVLYYFFLFGIILLCTKRRKPLWMLGILPLVSFLGVDFVQETKVCFLDVGQGDCIVAMTKSGSTYIFDGGSSSEKKMGENLLRPFLKYHGISKVDGIFLSHPDEDHVNGILELIEQGRIKIEALYLPQVDETCQEDFSEILMIAAELPVFYYSAGDSLQREDFQITCLHPNAGYNSESNAYSGCFLLAWEGCKVLLTGDVEGAGEVLLTEKMKNLPLEQVQVLKVAHHGSKFSTKTDFLKVVSPDLAVISCGKDNFYGHPHEETLSRLKAEDILYEITYETGCITVTEQGYTFFKRG